MTSSRFKLDRLDLLHFALEGINTAIGVNTGNPEWGHELWSFHILAQKEIERRIKILETQRGKE